MSEAPSPRGPEEVVVRRRVARRLAFVTSAVAVVLGLVGFAVITPFQRREAEAVAVDQLGVLAEAVASSYEEEDPRGPNRTREDVESELNDDDLETEHVHRARDMLRELQRADGVVAIDVANHRGVVRVSTQPVRVGTKQPVPRRLRSSAFDTETMTVSYAIPFTNRCVACHDAKNDPIGAVHVVFNRATALAALERYRLFSLILLAATYVVLVLTIVIVTDRLVGRPVFALAALMQKAERGDFLVRARVAGDDEIGALAMAFNRMLRSITALKADEVERERRLDAVNAELSIKKELAAVAGQLQASNAALERRIQGQELLMEAAHRLGSTLDKGALLERLGRVIRDKLGRPDFLIYLVVEDEDHEARLEVARASGLLDRDDVRSRRFRIGEGITGLVAETGAPLLVADLKRPFADTVAPPVETAPLIEDGSLLAVPMLHKGRVVGVFEFYDEKTNAFDQSDARLLEALGAQVAMAVVNADLYQTTLELSVTDTLTKLMNRRALNRLLDAELERARRFNTPLAVLMIDVDHFKQYNDRMGHLLGDDALRAVAAALQSSVRKVDAVARFGGEEFCVVLPRTDEAAGVEVAEKLLRAVRSVDIPGAKGQPLGKLSISVGVAIYPDDMPAAVDESAAKMVVDVADHAGYEAKKRGRDCVVAAGELRPRKPKLDVFVG